MTTVIRVGDVVLTRVLYADAAIDAGPTGLTPEDVRSVPWGEPTWSDGDQVRAAACVWVVESDGRTVVVDPAGNIDDILHDPATTLDHQHAFANAFATAGFALDAVDTILLSHVESVGIAAVRDGVAPGGWRPYFPNARLLLSETSRAAFDRPNVTDIVFEAFDALIAAELVDTFADGAEVLPGVHAEWTGAHNPGHTAFHVGSPTAPEVTFVGHLAVTPLHLVTGPCLPQHPEPERAWQWLQRFSADDRWLVGPLWPSPGAGRLTDAGFIGYPTAS